MHLNPVHFPAKRNYPENHEAQNTHDENRTNRYHFLPTNPSYTPLPADFHPYLYVLPVAAKFHDPNNTFHM